MYCRVVFLFTVQPMVDTLPNNGAEGIVSVEENCPLLFSSRNIFSCLKLRAATSSHNRLVSATVYNHKEHDLKA